MRPVFRCDYCNFIGTEKEVAEHEPNCFGNYNKRSCCTCSHKGYANFKQYKCACGKEIPEGMEVRFCDKYERKEKSENPLNDILDGIFGGL